MKTALIIPDCHVPYHDKKAVKLLKKVISYLRPQLSELVILGDFVDFYKVSQYPKDPRVSMTLLDEIEEANELLDYFDQELPRCKKVYLEGNHEKRLESYLICSAPALFGVTELRYLLKLNLRPLWSFQGYGPRQAHRILGSNLIARHAPPATTARLAAQKSSASLVYGHIHRIELAHVAGLLGQKYYALSPGWLGDEKASDVFGYVRDFHQWQKGFALAYADSKTSHFTQIINILDDYSCIVDGKLFKI